ncbi:putative GDP/GTP exchange factor Rom2p [Rhizophagus irregularis DAOM 181602=DAOM 197198]|nr:putative GDP/GTP exchange factor Rom2p [Rhizophagus irregularis DAOM 181602=DAOM 197198]
MSATHDAPPPIPPKPDSQGKPQNENDINQLLNLIDEELTISQEAYNTTHTNNISWNQPTTTTPLNAAPSPPIEPINTSYLSNRQNSETNITSLGRRSSGTSTSNHSQQSYNVPSSANTYQQHSYNTHQYYNPVQQQPYNNSSIPQAYGNAQYYPQANVPYNYYSSFPRDLTSQGWPAHNAHPNPSVRPLPNPSMSNTTYVQPYASAYNNTPYNYAAPPPISGATSMPGYSTQLVMPDFHFYKASGPPPPLQNEIQNQTQKNAQPLSNDDYPEKEYSQYHTQFPSASENTRVSMKNTKRSSSYGSSSNTSSAPATKKSYANGINGLMNPALLSNIALAFRATVNLGTHVKGALEYPDSFTGVDAVNTIYSLLPCDIPRHVALSMARSLESQLYFHSINWATVSVIQNNKEEVYTFLKPDPEAPSAWEWDEDFPTGVFPAVSKCYSPRCSIDGKGCYSRICSNYVPGVNEIIPEKSLEPSQPDEQPINTPETPVQPISQEQQTWTGFVPKEILSTVSKNELRRQEIIFETVYTENDYVMDLNLLETLYVNELRSASPPIISPAELDRFIQEVFYNVFDIRKHNKVMLERLQKRQKESYVVNNIGDIFLECALEFGNDYVNYNGHFPLADNIIKIEKARNPEFKQFLEQCSRKPEARKLDFRHFAQRPTTRLQRYTLLLEQVIKYTSDDNRDKEVLENALHTIRELCRESDDRVHEAEKRLRIVELERKLVKKNNEPYPELKLRDPNRQLIFKGELQRKSDIGFEWLDLYVFLFDHYLVMTKPRKGPDGEVRYVISKKPIPLDMLIVDSGSENIQQNKSTFFSNLGSINSALDSRKRTNSVGQNSMASPLVTDLEGPENLLSRPSLHSFTIIHIGRNGGSYQLFADSANSRKMWKEKIAEAQTKLQLNGSSKQVFELFTLNDATFGTAPIGTSGATGASKGKVTCSVPFALIPYLNFVYPNSDSKTKRGCAAMECTKVTPERRNMVAIGTEDGVWMGFGGETKTFRPVLTGIGNVMQMAVIEVFGIFVVLVDKALWAYSLESLIPSSTNVNTSSRTQHRQRLSASNNIQYFNVGTIKDTTFLVFMKKRGLESHFKILEPIGTGGQRKGMFQMRNDNWFKEYKQFYVPSESYSVNFLRSKLCVTCTRGFEIVNLDTLQNNTIPDLSHPQFASIARRCDNSKPLGMLFRLDDNDTNEFLLCYDEIFFYVDKHGELSRPTVVEWEGKPEAVAIQLPYIIGFNPLFIEIRDVQTGKLCQVISGKNMRCLNDNSSGRNAIHAVMQHPFNDTQYVFQLVLADIRRSDSMRGTHR